MPIKSIHKDHYDLLLQQLREVRLSAGLTQAALSTALKRPQSYVSDVERGSRRMDLLQLRAFCNACGISLTKFVTQFEKALK
ncbi:helix-turn-helix domain-containing protein [Xanthomonas sp. NCPPB 1067]|uniref:helix-turn-helix domain-containing protein n=1 Tax=Xanthomonas TaxID=338 RepID=UPI001E2F6FD1|nr:MULTISPECIES: helix-turn-helix transcriptional regulator [Xanthomonas]MCC4588930.1 helix-turn-helix domain-containing protein [Xanthomonas sp. NCPPB 1067]MCD0244646.1 helix-turn-helix transcriptional regulator [Xanthomonas melonis]